MSPKIEDAAQCILDRAGPLPVMKLHRLCYYAQAWHLAWKGYPLFYSRLEFRETGPVSTRLRDLFGRARYISHVSLANTSRLDVLQRHTIMLVVNFYGQWSSKDLSEQTILESHWLGIPPAARSGFKIRHEAMLQYYRSL